MCNKPVKNLPSLGVPYSIISMLSSIGIRPSCVPFTSNNLQLGFATIPSSTSEKSFCALSRNSSSVAYPNFSRRAGRAVQGYSWSLAFSSHSREKK
jgi:hypothetical protein